jgi:hypothetical protein
VIGFIICFEASMANALEREGKPFALTLYLILGFVLLVVALIARAPASLLQKALPAGLPVLVTDWGGTVWDGQAIVRHEGESNFVRWRLQPGRLLVGHLAAEVEAKGALHFVGWVEMGRQFWQLQNIRGELPTSMLQPLLPAGWQLPGSVRAESLSLAREGHGKGPWKVAGGRLLWGGGAMQYSMNGQAQSAHLPALVMNLRLDGETLALSLNEEGGNLGLAVLRLTPDGMVETQLRERLLRYSPGYHGSGSDLDAVVVTARQPL